ncbi:MAG: FAD-binding protein [Fusobacteriaceae bacterium]
MKKFFLTALITLSTLIFTGCGNSVKEKEFIGKANSFTGDIKVKVTTAGDQIKNLELLSHKDTQHIVDRTFPIVKERILKSQTPIVDSVSGATYTSTGIKKAVAAALKSEGKEFGTINLRTKGPEQPVVNLETVKTDLLIVGGGPAGLAAAISAKEAGLENIIMIEKLDILSGNGKYDMNFYDLINSEAEKKAGVQDSIEKLIADNSNSIDSPERTRAQAQGSAILDKWLRGMGIKLNHYYGKRGHMAEADQYAGAHIQDGMEAKVKALGIDVRTNTKGLDLLMDKGTVKGIKVQNGNNFYEIEAKAVIMATGGFSANKELLAKYAPGTEEFQTSNQLGATGDFIPVFQQHGIATANLDVINIFPFIIGATRDLTGGGDGFILINKNGERFTSEQITYATRQATAKKILEQPDSEVFYLYDENLYKSSYRLQKHVGAGLHTKAETLEELADVMGINIENLKKTVESFNAAIRGEISDPFRAKSFTREIKTEGPYYAVQVESAVHMTRGGVVADEKTQVYSEDGKLVKGLYAAGEVTSSNAAYSAAVIFGRIAGEEAVKFIKE